MRRIIFIITFLSVVWLPPRTCLSYQYAYRHYSHEIEWAVNDVGILEESNIFFAGDEHLVIYNQDYYLEDIVAVQINIGSTDSTIVTDFGEDREVWEIGGWNPPIFDGVSYYWHDYGPELSSVVRITEENEGRVVPEPATMILLGAGLIGLAGFSRKRFKK